MILLHLSLLMLLAPVYSVGNLYSKGDSRLSKEFLELLRREAEHQRQWINEILNVQNSLRYTGNTHEQVPSSNDVQIRKESKYGSYQESTTVFPSDYHQKGGLLDTNSAGNGGTELKSFPDSDKRPLTTGSVVVHKNIKNGNANSPYLFSDDFNDETHKDESVRRKVITIKVGNHEIRLRPGDYESIPQYNSDIGRENSLLFKDRDIEAKNEIFDNDHSQLYTDKYEEPHHVITVVKHHEPSDPAVPVVEGKELRHVIPGVEHKGPQHVVPSVEHKGPHHHVIPSVEQKGPHHVVPVIEQETNLKHPVITELIDYAPIIDQEPNNVESFENLHSSIEFQYSTEHISEDYLPKYFGIHEVYRDVITNGKLQKIQEDKDGISIAERILPVSSQNSLEKSIIPNTEAKSEHMKGYPPLLIEEISLSGVNYIEPSEYWKFINVSGETPNEQSEIELEHKFATKTTRTSAVVSDVAEIDTQSPQTDTFDSFQALNISIGSGDREIADGSSDTEALHFLHMDANEELIEGRKLSSDSSVDPFLSEEGSGISSNEDSVDALVEGSRSPRIINIFATPNDSSTPCITPKSEPGHCKDLRHCILHEVLNNFNLYLQYMCLIRHRFVGVCCPDNPVISHTPEPDDDNVTDSATEDSMEFTQPIGGCGVNMKTRIVGGSISKPHEWTWMVALLKKNRFFCGGVLINNWYVLTAAHCTLGMRTRDLKVRLGEYNFQEPRDHKEDITIQEIKRHAQFITLTFQHDIALLKLKRPVQFSRFVGSICLPEANNTYREVNATVAGWGTISFGGAASPILREVTLPVWKNEDCDTTYRLEDINDSFLCAGSPELDQDACQGDSGGPLMAMNSNGRWEAIGIVSWGRRCGDPKYPGVYTRITTYLDWIEKNLT